MAQSAIFGTENVIFAGPVSPEPGIGVEPRYAVHLDPECRHIQGMNYILGRDVQLHRLVHRYIQLVGNHTIRIFKHPGPHPCLDGHFHGIIGYGTQGLEPGPAEPEHEHDDNGGNHGPDGFQQYAAFDIRRFRVALPVVLENEVDHGRGNHQQGDNGKSQDQDECLVHLADRINIGLSVHGSPHR